MGGFVRKMAAAFGLVCAVAFGAPLPTHAFCVGQNILDEIPSGERAALQERANLVPYARGNFWTARRAGTTLILVGTYHLDDPRHAPTVQALLPYFDDISRLYVEAGPEEEEALSKLLADNPSLVFIQSGQSLLEKFEPAQWRKLSRAFEDRGLPAPLAAKLQPWYAATVLALPPCQIKIAAQRSGLDAQLIALARGKEVPVVALEPYDTILNIFGALEEKQLLSMIISTMAIEDEAEDLAVTLADLYFRGDARLIWEISRYKTLQQEGVSELELEAELAALEQEMMVKRNHAWVDLLHDLPPKSGEIMVAVGALHLSGEAGVLALLAARGWELSPLPLPQQ